jgi:hypothetical protein
MTKPITTTVSDEFHSLAESFNIQWAEAMRIGLAVLFMERGVSQFENPLNKLRVKSLAQKLGLVVV